jgi:hypothetical protein
MEQTKCVKRFGIQTSKPYHLTMSSDTMYTDSMIQNCNGRLRCYNCARTITGEIFFYPERFTQTNEFECNPLPHCRPSCARRTVQDISNHFDLLSIFYLMYPREIVCAPPRLLLYLPGGLTIERYHDTIDKNNSLEVEQLTRVRTVLSDVIVSGITLNDYQIEGELLQMVDSLQIEKSTKDVKPSKVQQENVSHQNVVSVTSVTGSKRKISQGK